MKILSIVGARPQFVKSGIVSRELRSRGIQEILIHTGQHYDFNMSDIFFEELNLPQPDYHLGIGSGPHGEQTGKMLIEIEKVILKEKPNIVLVYGDTNTTLAGAIASSKLHIPLAHVEAGPRSYNKKMPEEINRVVTDYVSDYLFVATQSSIENLHKEGITTGIYLIGDVMLDVALETIKLVDKKEVLGKFKLEVDKYVVVTIHRADNTEDLTHLKNILSALEHIADSGFDIILPLHPRTKKIIDQNNIAFPNAKNIKVIEPVSYKEMIVLEKNAYCVVTDSGGVQREAFFFRKPCLTLIDEKVWIETFELGWNIATGPDKEKIIKSFDNIDKMDKLPGNPFGDGYAHKKIVDILIREKKN